jgi:hypothetical protein
MDEATEPIPALHPAVRHDDPIDGHAGPTLSESLVRPSVVIVLDELLQHSLQVPSTEDQQLVQALAPSGSD